MDSDAAPLDQCPECCGIIQEGTGGGLCVACLLQGALGDGADLPISDCSLLSPLTSESTGEAHPAEGDGDLRKQAASEPDDARSKDKR